MDGYNSAKQLNRWWLIGNDGNPLSLGPLPVFHRGRLCVCSDPAQMSPDPPGQQAVSTPDIDRLVFKYAGVDDAALSPEFSMYAFFILRSSVTHCVSTNRPKMLR